MTTLKQLQAKYPEFSIQKTSGKHPYLVFTSSGEPLGGKHSNLSEVEGHISLYLEQQTEDNDLDEYEWDLNDIAYDGSEFSIRESQTSSIIFWGSFQETLTAIAEYYDWCDCHSRLLRLIDEWEEVDEWEENEETDKQLSEPETSEVEGITTLQANPDTTIVFWNGKQTRFTIHSENGEYLIYEGDRFLHKLPSHELALAYCESLLNESVIGKIASTTEGNLYRITHRTSRGWGGDLIDSQFNLILNQWGQKQTDELFLDEIEMVY